MKIAQEGRFSLSFTEQEPYKEYTMNCGAKQEIEERMESFKDICSRTQALGAMFSDSRMDRYYHQAKPLDC